MATLVGSAAEVTNDSNDPENNAAIDTNQSRATSPLPVNAASTLGSAQKRKSVDEMRDKVRGSFASLGDLSLIEANCWEQFLAGEIVGGCFSFWIIFLGMFIIIVLGAVVGGKINTTDRFLVQSDPIVKAWYGQLEIRSKLCEYGDSTSLQVMNQGNSQCGLDSNRRLEGDSWRVDDEIEHHAKHELWGLLPLQIAIRRLNSDQAVRRNTGPAVIGMYEATGTDCPGSSCKLDSHNVLQAKFLDEIKKFETKLWGDAAWKQKYCSLLYPDSREYTGVYSQYSAPEQNAVCAPPTSIIQQLYFDNSHTARESVKELFDRGLGSSFGKCACVHEATAPCPTCASASTKLVMRDCLKSEITRLKTILASQGGNDEKHYQREIPNSWCLLLGNSTCETPDPYNGNPEYDYDKELNEFISGIVELFCTSLSSDHCQWSAPAVHSWCSSNAWSFVDHGAAAAPLTGSAYNSMLSKLCDPAESSMSYLRNSYFIFSACENSGANLLSKGTPFMKSSWAAGTPFEAGHSGDNSYEAAKNKLEDEYASNLMSLYDEARSDADSSTDGDLRIILFSDFTVNQQIYGLLYHDGGLAVASFIFVFLYMWFTTESFFLSACGMWEILMSIPPAMLTWGIIDGNGLSTLQFLTIYMILGIGADDVFVLLDAWKQARFVMGDKATTTQVFVVGYRRAFSAMLTTTFTTGAAFLFGAFSSIPMVADFCIFAAAVVVWDYIWCVTFFASAVCVYERYFEGKSCCCYGDKKEPGVCCGPGCCWGGVRALWMLTHSNASADDPQARKVGGDQRFIEQLFGDHIFHFVQRFRFPLIAFWLSLVIGMTVSASVGIKTASKPPEIGSQSHDLVRFATLQLNYWTQEQEQQVFVGFGLNPDPSVNKYTKQNPVEVELNWASGNAMDIATSAGQQKVLDLCKAMDTNAGTLRCESTTCLVRGAASSCERDEAVWAANKIHLTKDGTCLLGRYCFMEYVEEFALYHGGLSFPVPDLVGVLKNNTFKEYLERKRNLNYEKGRHWEGYLMERSTGWVIEGSILKFAWVGFNATFGERPSNKDSNDFNKRWDDFVKEKVPGTSGTKTAEVFNFMVTQNELVHAAIQGMVTSLSVAFFVLFLVTCNIIIALIGLANITCITVVFLGLIPILGWELGTSECIFLIAVVGLSVDYSVHMLHSYNEQKGTREEKMKNALETMGISVFSGAATTLMAAIPLFLCWMRFFSQYGAFIFFVCLFSFILAIGLLPPLLLIFGPEDDCGNLCICAKKIAGFEKQIDTE